MKLKRFWDGLLDLLFPPKCPFCQQILEHPGICEPCQLHLPYIEETPIRELGNGLRCAAPLWYEGDVREGLLRFKFRGARTAAGPMGMLLADIAAECFPGEFDTVTWVPVSKKRKRKRGYDQAELLARAACRYWDTRPVRLLVKSTHNPAQSGIHDDAARRANVLGVYDPIREDRIAGHRILLVDDICTTGSTLGECARVLQEAGAESVVCVTVAQARKKPEAGRPCGGNTQETRTKSH